MYRYKMQNISNIITKRILVLDGSMGTLLQAMDLKASDFGGEEFLGCNEQLNLTSPEVVIKVHEAYLEAGADIVETNTFGATPLVLEEYGLQDKSFEINKCAAELARKACDKVSTTEKPRFVAGSMGPTTKSLSLSNEVDFQTMADAYRVQAEGLIAGGCDYLLLETAMDTLNLKAAWMGICAVGRGEGQGGEHIIEENDKPLTTHNSQTGNDRQVPVAVSVTIEDSGTMLAGQGIEALYVSIAHMNPLYVGMNCATGADKMKEHLRALAGVSEFPISIVPNAGMPDENGVYGDNPKAMAGVLAEYADSGWINVVGGCCGTTPEHIESIARVMKGRVPRIMDDHVYQTMVSGIEALGIEEEGRPYIVGERANVIGSRIFKNLISTEKFDEAVETVRKQVKAGAHIIDLCVSNPDRDELHDMSTLLTKARHAMKAPFMIDSQDKAVVEAAFKLTQGKCILNSINLENGEKTFQELVPLVKQYGAAVIVGCIAEKMALTADDKLAVAVRSYELLTEKYGINECDIIFDPLVFPCGTGEEHYFGSGKETIEAVELIKKKYPNCKTLLGVSNVSFGLPAAGREALNSALVYHSTKAGLDLAIVNAEKISRYGSLSEEEKQLCDDLLWYRTENGNEPIANFANYYREKTASSPLIDQSANRPANPEERIPQNIVEGSKDGLINDLDELREKISPLEIINGPLMAGMAKVGELFKNNELIVAEVLQSAEVMKTAVDYLEPMMKEGEKQLRGSILLATVSGDVHDIGKNLLQIILSNNGFEVIDLGIKCSSQKLIEAYQNNPTSMIGLSGLLVKSVQQMASTAADLNAAGIHVPLLLGGAALSKRFVEEKIAPIYKGHVLYCPDAMSGLEAALDVASLKLETRAVGGVVSDDKQSTINDNQGARDVGRMVAKVDTRGLPDGEVHVVGKSFCEVLPFLNESMIYVRHLGYKGPFNKHLKEKNEKALSLYNKVQGIITDKEIQDLFKLQGVYSFFEATTSGNTVTVGSGNQEQTAFDFPRQIKDPQLCLADYLASGATDSINMFVVTCGNEIDKKIDELSANGAYLDAQILAALAFEMVEAMAEAIHKEIRQRWGIEDKADLTINDILKAKYIGKRFSFGYPACPNLEDQEKLWKLLAPDTNIGVQLTDGFMMQPQASISAIVFHHPEASYFTINS